MVFSCLKNNFPRSLTKRYTSIIRPYLESTHFFFACLKKHFSRNLTKRPTAILGPFLKSIQFAYLKTFSQEGLPRVLQQL